MFARGLLDRFKVGGDQCPVFGSEYFDLVPRNRKEGKLALTHRVVARDVAVIQEFAQVCFIVFQMADGAASVAPLGISADVGRAYRPDKFLESVPDWAVPVNVPLLLVASFFMARARRKTSLSWSMITPAKSAIFSASVIRTRSGMAQRASTRRLGK